MLWRNLLASYAHERKARLIKVYYAQKAVQLTKKLLPVLSASTSESILRLLTHIIPGKSRHIMDKQ
jgi:hypothetical protein